jgi:segregation and condensation protein B
MTLQQVVETLVTAAEEPLDSEGLANAIRQSVAIRAGELAEGENLPGHLAPFAETTAEQVEAAIQELNAAYVAHGHALSVVLRPRGWQLMTRPDFADFLGSLFPERRTHRLSGPALETLAIIAYRQPVTKAEIESVRGVSADGMIQKLLDLELVKIGGRAELPGRPLQYVTTGKFLEHFNLHNVEDLPNSQELRRVKLPTAEEVHGVTATENATAEGELNPETTGAATPADAVPGQAEISFETPEAVAPAGDPPLEVAPVGAEMPGGNDGEGDKPAAEPAS